MGENVGNNGCLLAVIKAERAWRQDGIDLERFLKEDACGIVTVSPNASLEGPAAHGATTL